MGVSLRQMLGGALVSSPFVLYFGVLIWDQGLAVAAIVAALVVALLAAIVVGVDLLL